MVEPRADGLASIVNHSDVSVLRPQTLEPGQVTLFCCLHATAVKRDDSGQQVCKYLCPP